MLAVLEIPLGQVSALVGSISLGLGVDDALPVTERFSHEPEAGADVATALHRTVVGTGGALLSSAVTTAAGFGVLAVAVTPALQQFGISLGIGTCTPSSRASSSCRTCSPSGSDTAAARSKRRSRQ
ncbi:MMPL family transporter [Natrinema halophilum]|nr:MMPL family transporter [Natrinema halophilum]QLG50095.2 MMPL family transporter [Natrinema halophilum]